MKTINYVLLEQNAISRLHIGSQEEEAQELNRIYEIAVHAAVVTLQEYEKMKEG